MPRTILQEIIKHVQLDHLPPSWSLMDLKQFSPRKSLWDYQQEALASALKVLWKYFEEAQDYREGEKATEASRRRKQAFFRWYRENGLEADLSINLKNENRALRELLAEYYPLEGGESPKISYEHFINRLGFWMATGSGKTLVLIKLMEVLHTLIRRREIPPFDFLVLTHREDLITQLKACVEEFNYSGRLKINLQELKDYPEVKGQQGAPGLTVFYYRSDNISDEQKDKIVDFRNYDNGGRWYIFLDEAHKGDREDSKRQHLYSIMARNGFLFNFSATFTDVRDVTTTAYNFNLEKYIRRGYGKHIAVLQQEVRGFRDGEDYTGEEKQRVVVQSLILLTYVHKFYEEIAGLMPGSYHRPLMLVLTHSVNIKDADLELFFRELARVGRGDVDRALFEGAKAELWKELAARPTLMLEAGERLTIERKVLEGITTEDLWRYVYNAGAPGEIEVLRRPTDKRELAFKLKTGERPFALLKIGEVAGWLQEKLAGYEVQEDLAEESYFQDLNQADCPINLLMGSRSFYEGWDSNRPNIICYINIGGQDARKFILQSLGRGVRIEPVKGKRRRLLFLYRGGEVERKLFEGLKSKVLPLETLFVLATNRKALVEIVSRLEEIEDARDAGPHDSAGAPLALGGRGEDVLKGGGGREKPEIGKEDYALLRKWLSYLGDDRVLLMRYHLEPRELKLLRDLAADPANFNLDGKNLKDPDLLVEQLIAHCRTAVRAALSARMPADGGVPSEALRPSDGLAREEDRKGALNPSRRELKGGDDLVRG
ncbi:MAG TPA: restriction endonuclease subunit R [Peptococcaceae bacterium]|nr:restriction endonuclease subunit R [Peptococcaceae bacterium]